MQHYALSVTLSVESLTYNVTTNRIMLHFNIMRYYNIIGRNNAYPSPSQTLGLGLFLKACFHRRLLCVFCRGFCVLLYVLEKYSPPKFPNGGLTEAAHQWHSLVIIFAPKKPKKIGAPVESSSTNFHGSTSCNLRSSRSNVCHNG